MLPAGSDIDYGSISLRDNDASQHTNESTNKKTHKINNRTKYALMCLFVFATICLILPYSTKMIGISSQQPSQTNEPPINHEFISHHQQRNDNNNDRRDIVIDVFDAHTAFNKEFIAAPPGSAPWRQSHDALIIDNGYNPNDASVRYTFRVYDTETAHLFEQELDSEGFFQKFRDKNKRDKQTQRKTGKTKRGTTAPPTKRPPAKKSTTPSPKNADKTADRTQGNMRCYSKYMYDNQGINGGHNGYYIVMDCGKHTLTGCFSYSIAGEVSGELAEQDEETGIKTCRAFASDGKQANNGNGDYVGIGARCCLPLEEDVVLTTAVTVIDSVENSKYEKAWNADGLCQTANILDFKKYTHDNYQIMGCSGWAGIDMPYSGLAWSAHTMTKQMIGTRLIYGTSGSNWNDGHCMAHRGDTKGFISSGAIGGRVNKGQLDCVLVESTDARAEGNMFISTANCGHGYLNVDCNAYLDGYMDQCLDPIADGLRSYGGKFNIEHGCDAYGNTKAIRAQAHCCKIINKGSM